MNLQEQIKEIEKHASSDMPAELLMAMNRKYRELKNKQKKLLE